VLKLPVVGELWGPTGSAQLDRLELPEAYALRLDSLRNLLDVYDRAIGELDGHIHAELKGDAGYRALMTLPGVGKVIAAIFVAEIGDIARFDSAKKLCNWAGLTPSTASPTRSCTAGRSPSRARPSSGEPPSRPWATTGPRATRSSAPTTSGIAERRGKYKARVAVARKLLTLVFYAMRNGEVRCLDTPAAA